MDINATMLGQMITFAILVIFTMKFVWPPLNEMLEKRAQQIADGLTIAQKAKQELLDAEVKVAEELKHVQLRATEIIANSQKRAQQIVEEAQEQAVKDSTKILEAAKLQIEQEFNQAKEKLRAQVAMLAIKGAEQILKAEINEERHQAILTQLKAQL